MITNYDICDVESNLILYFKHLVESKGLNSLLSKTLFEQKKKIWEKNDEFIFGLMQHIYDNAGE
jgi:hypothetical protein